MGKLKNVKTGSFLDYIEERVEQSQFTDGGAAVGTYVLKQQIPVGASVIQALVTDVVAFAGDTSCTLTIGDGTDADRYNTGTPSIFAATDMVTMGAPSGVREHSAAKSVTLTATSASDWGSVTGGALTVRIVYLVGG